jgi:L-seryl-tRNA(Ser) seleniumtransferase
MKVGKEEMLGLLAAVEWSLAQDEAAVIDGYERSVKLWIAGLSKIPGVQVERGYPSEAGQPHARAIVRFGPRFGLTRDEVVSALWDRDPRIAVGEIGDNAIALNPQTLQPGEDEQVLQAVQHVLHDAQPQTD